MKSFTFTGALVLAAMAGSAMGQSLNIDVNRTTGTGSGAPASTFGAAAGQTGTWNAFTASATGPVAMVDLAGANSGVTLSRSGDSSSSSGTATTGAASADYSKLMYDFNETFGPNDSVTYTLNGLDQGFYRLYVYANIPGSGGFYVDGFGFTNYHGSTISLELGGASAGYGTTYGPVVGGEFKKGVTHNVFNVAVGAGAPALAITSYPSDNVYFAAKSAINGMQLVKITGNRLYVDGSRTLGLQTGMSWTDAMTSLDDALDAAKASNGQITEIWVADGVYKPVPSNSRSAFFDIPSGVKIYGGFNGTESRFSQRDPATYLTVLSGDGASLVTTTDNLYHVVKMVNCSSSTLLDGFTIRGGRADLNSTSSGISDQTGGAIVINGGFPFIRNCTFTNNFAAVEGGAIMIQGAASPDIIGCTFYNNSAGSYGGAVRSTTSSNAQMNFINNRFLTNYAGSNGGAINTTGGVMQFVNSLFAGNSADANGGAVYCFSPTVKLINCTVAQNQAGTYGGLGVSFNGHADVSNVLFYNNTDTSVSTNNQGGNLGKDSGGTITMNYSRVFGLDGSLGGAGNISGAPLFVDGFGPDNIAGTVDDNWALQSNSAGVDAGSNSLLPSDYADLDADSNSVEALPLDLALNTRRVDVATVPDTGLGSKPLVDMGAYETTYCAADFNDDGFLTFEDFDAFVAAFEAGQTNSDFNGDGFLTFEDFDAYVAAFEAGC